jgi:hypothetical protein
MVAVTQSSHPRLWTALEHVLYDNDMVNRYRSMPNAIELDCTLAEANRAEAALSVLSDDELETFAIGEVEDQVDLSEKHMDLGLASDLLNNFFETYE